MATQLYHFLSDIATSFLAQSIDFSRLLIPKVRATVAQ
jgi:hypothetical protein